MNCSLNDLFFSLCNDDNSACIGKCQEDLFGYSDETAALPRQYEETDIKLISNYFSNNFTPSLLDEPVRCFFELSSDVFDIVIHAWMSELPIEKELFAFGRKIIEAANTAASPDAAALDRSDHNTVIILKAAEKVQREIHRMQGLLRFSPETNGIYTARCAPDHLIIPSFSEYLTARFGETAWVVIDEKRSIFLSRKPYEKSKISILKSFASEDGQQEAYQRRDEWEELWKHYHKTVNNESRKNTGLQRQLMPKRYWKYLPEA